MSDTAPRGISNLAPRKVDPKRMLARNRDDATDIPPAAASSAAEATAPAQQPDRPATERSAAPEKKPQPKASKAPRTAAQAAQGRVNTYIDVSARARVVAAYKATSHLEGDESFSAFVETALVNEALRREQLYNSGDEFVAMGNLQRGRPVRG